MKRTVNRAKSIKVPIISAEAQYLVTPPQCMSRRTQTRAAIIAHVPILSKLRIISHAIATALFAAFGVLKKARISARDTPPIGRLI